MPQDVFAALADQTRRSILRLLAEHPLSAGEIAAQFPQQRPAISKHISTLKDAGLLLERRLHQKRIYSLNRLGLDPLAGLVRQLQPGPPAEPQLGMETPKAGVVRPMPIDSVRQVAETETEAVADDGPGQRAEGLDLDFD